MDPGLIVIGLYLLLVGGAWVYSEVEERQRLADLLRRAEVGPEIEYAPAPPAAGHFAGNAFPAGFFTAYAFPLYGTAVASTNQTFVRAPYWGRF